MSPKTIRYADVKAELLKNPDVCREYSELEPAYQIARLRIARGLTQQQLADLVGTKQPSIARLESGKSAPRLSFLQQVVEALGGKLTVRVEMSDDVQREASCDTLAR